MAMKKPIPMKFDEAWPYSLRELALFPTLLTVGAALAAFIVALITGGPEIFTLAAGFVLGLSVIFFSVTFVIGGLGLIPAVLRRAYRWVARLRGRDLAPGSALRDDWVDGP